MSYPTMDQYNDVVQHPQNAFSDPALKTAKIATNGMGLPIALGGGFALTYTAKGQGGKYAVRCFHKEAKGLEARYLQVDKGLRAAGGSYFVGFEYQPAGVLVNGVRYPIVKMDWVEGDTLGTFLEDNYADPARMVQLRAQFTELEKFLRGKSIAHGDLQNGNVLVKSGLKLIDYDGVYVPTLPQGQGAELGHKHFQHPKRSASDFGPEMDRFSFIVLDLSLRAIAENSKLFTKYSNGENILLTANDFMDPGSSAAFADLRAIPALARDTAHLASICASSVKSVPTLSEFLSGANIPPAVVTIRSPTEAKVVVQAAAYVGAYDVVDASNFALVSQQVGNRIELVGQVTKVHVGKTRYGKPFCFVFLLDQSKQAVKLNIWSEGMAKLTPAPSETWVGKWLSIQGLVDPAWSSSKYGTSVSITINGKSQLRTITQSEARHRLSSPRVVTRTATSNRDILAGLGSSSTSASRATKAPTHAKFPPKTTVSQSNNQALLSALQRAPAATPVNPAKPQIRASHPTPSANTQTESSWGWWVLAAIVFVIFLAMSG
ncbi:hypothetical protein [Novosphingobium sp. BL-52-GroH]|uniref:hypothetical protein n=1 Tax=Novosphingobium sp. BL-52-GroH TaxID=3349877 RepID=UPI00384F09BE